MTIYQSIYNIIEQYIFGTVQAGSHQELVTILMSTFGCILCFALPFVLVWLFIKIITRCL